MLGDLYIDNVELPDNIDDIKIGDDFDIKWVVINTSVIKHRTVVLKVGISWITDVDILNIPMHLVGYDTIDRPKKWVKGRSFIKKSNEFDITSKLYEEAWFGFRENLQNVCVTKHRVKAIMEK